MQQPSPSAQSNYNYPLPRVPLTSSQVGTKISISIGGSFQQAVWVEMSNESPYTIACYSLQGVLLNSIQPQICDIFQLPQGDNSFIVIPGILIPQAAPSSELDINIYPFGQPSGPYPFPLARQSTPTAGTQTGFSTTVTFGPTASATAINIWNPVTNTKKAVIYQARMVLVNTVASTTVVPRFGFTNNGVNNNLANNPGIVPNDGGSDISTLTASSALGGTQPVISEIWEGITFAVSNLFLVYDFCPFNDQKVCLQGNNAWLLIGQISGTPSYTVVFTLKWTEQ